MDWGGCAVRHFERIGTRGRGFLGDENRWVVEFILEFDEGDSRAGVLDSFNMMGAGLDWRIARLVTLAARREAERREGSCEQVGSYEERYITIRWAEEESPESECPYGANTKEAGHNVCDKGESTTRSKITHHGVIGLPESFDVFVNSRSKSGEVIMVNYDDNFGELSLGPMTADNAVKMPGLNVYITG
ncbi:hypothetical protein QAD02_021635 [Eretmocerus hayati]|uniref:Uncharacterized protein n=1 Tax=Eretmocerus hayati TaxID=131215 RepID=A0ACC2PTZ2_9HYME|nr:hypothetical protein QAD02_021635 [Eretmocerus hayati]